MLAPLALPAGRLVALGATTNFGDATLRNDPQGKYGRRHVPQARPRARRMDCRVPRPPGEISRPVARETGRDCRGTPGTRAGRGRGVRRDHGRLRARPRSRVDALEPPG